MNLESVTLELENKGINIVDSSSEYYWDNESIVFEWRHYHILVYVYEDGLKYYLLTREIDEEDGEMMFCTSEMGTCDTIEEMINDIY